MIVTRPGYFDRFACWQDKCPMTCCAGWEIAVDQETQDGWKTLAHPYAQTAESTVKDGVFQMNGCACVHLQDGLCRIHRTLGVGATPLTCRRFPVFHHDFGGRIEEGLCLSCPAAAELIFDAPCTLCDTETGGLPAPNDIDPALFLQLQKKRRALLALCQKENVSKKELLQALYDAALGAETASAKTAEAKSAPPGTARTRQSGTDGEHGSHLQILKKKLELLDYSAQNRPQLYQESPSLPTVEFKKLYFYYVFRYFLLPALGECSAAAMGRFLLVMLIGCDLAGRKNAPALAKEAEHCDENLQRLQSEKEPFISSAALQNIIGSYPDESM